MRRPANCGQTNEAVLMLLFIDESGFDHSGTPCEVLAGVAVAEESLWNLIRAVRGIERELFGDYLRTFLIEERKAKRMLKTKRFRSANRNVQIAAEDLTPLAHSALVKGKAAREHGVAQDGASERELVAYSRQVLRFVHEVLNIAASFNVQVFATMVDPNAPRLVKGKLRMDYIRLFERYFYFLETFPPRERGLVVFDELEKSLAHGLVQQMAAYFLGHPDGQYQSSRIVPEPFFVHSDLTTGVFLADLTAYILGWGWRLQKMPQPVRADLQPYASKLHDMQFHGEKPKADGTGVWPLHGITYLDDLRGQAEK
jgi:hypothetical protein